MTYQRQSTIVILFLFALQPILARAQEKAAKTDLLLNLHAEYFRAILDGTKTIEYRDKSDYWDKRLAGEKGKRYTRIIFRNGYAKKVPEMMVELKKIDVKDGQYRLHLGKIIQKSNLELLKK